MTSAQFLHYKPGLTLDAPIAVTMAAADWLVFMNWLGQANTDEVNHLVYPVIAKQLQDALYTPASLKAAHADYAERSTQQLPSIIQHLTGMVPLFPQPEDFGKEDDE